MPNLKMSHTYGSLQELECFVVEDTQACAVDLSLQDSQTILCLLLPKAVWRQDKQSFCFKQLDAFSMENIYLILIVLFPFPLVVRKGFNVF